MKINAIRSHDLNKVWPYILRYVQEALTYEHGALTPKKIFEALQGNDWFLLVAWEGEKIYSAQTCEIVTINNEKIMNLVTTGGIELERWQNKMSDAIELIAIEQQCAAILTRGRIGWLKVLKRNGFKPLYFIAEKRLKKCQVLSENRPVNPKVKTNRNHNKVVTDKTYHKDLIRDKAAQRKMSGNRKAVR